MLHWLLRVYRKIDASKIHKMLIFQSDKKISKEENPSCVSLAWYADTIDFILSRGKIHKRQIFFIKGKQTCVFTFLVCGNFPFAVLFLRQTYWTEIYDVFIYLSFYSGKIKYRWIFREILQINNALIAKALKRKFLWNQVRAFKGLFSINFNIKTYLSDF